MNNLPPWFIRLGGVFGVLASALLIVPDTAPGAHLVKPWASFLAALSSAVVGLTARQNNVSSEQAGATQPKSNP